jgi:hypothetical protein
MTYQFAAEQIGAGQVDLPAEDAKASPATLSGSSSRNGQLEHIGAMATEGAIALQ